MDSSIWNKTQHQAWTGAKDFQKVISSDSDVSKVLNTFPTPVCF